MAEEAVVDDSSAGDVGSSKIEFRNLDGASDEAINDRGRVDARASGVDGRRGVRGDFGMVDTRGRFASSDPSSMGIS